MGGLIKFLQGAQYVQRWYVEDIGQHGGNTFNATALGESRELYLNIARLTLFGCIRHPDAKPVKKLQTINLEPGTSSPIVLYSQYEKVIIRGLINLIGVLVILI